LQHVPVKFIQFNIVDGSAKCRHPGESRGPEAVKHYEKNWIPAFAGMTKKRLAGIFAIASLISVAKKCT
jgi:hypothetical protein